MLSVDVDSAGLVDYDSWVAAMADWRGVSRQRIGAGG
jgi:hypothetical protein